MNPTAFTQIQEGMGAIPHAEGVAFRVWAPNAEAVSVIGSFNDFDVGAHPMIRDDTGKWYADVSGAKPGDRYRYHIRRGDSEFSRIDPYAREVTDSNGDGIVHEPFEPEAGGKTPGMPNWNEAVIYELHIGTFGKSGTDKPATFDDAIAGLDHLEKLGVNVLQLMPIAEFAGDFSWGYNPAHPFAIESAYGGPAAFRRFIAEAHRRGFAIILDVVYNHFGPGDLHLWQFDGWSENGFGGIYFYNDERARTPWGETRPDYGRGEVREYLRDNALQWVRDYGVDGLRFDMTLFIRTVDGTHELPDGWSLMQWINDEVRRVRPDALTIAEDLQRNPWITMDTGAGGAGYGAQWAASFVHSVRAVTIAAEDESRSMQAVTDALGARLGEDAFRRIVYTESHDEVANGKARVPHEIDGENGADWFAAKRSTLAAALVFTAPGIPMIFQGQEFLETGWFRDDIPLDWDRAQNFRGITRLYRDLVRIRRNLDGVSRGLSGHGFMTFHLNEAENIIAYQRWQEHGPGDDVIVVVNFSRTAKNGYTIGFPESGVWRVRFNSDSTGYSRNFGNEGQPSVEAAPEGRDGMPASASLDLPPYSALILSRDK